MSVQYVHLRPEDILPSIACNPVWAAIITEADASEDWRERVTEWLVQSGCLQAVAGGRGCARWHDSVDGANLMEFDYGDIPDDRFVMTIWHENEPLEEALWFAGQSAFSPYRQAEKHHHRRCVSGTTRSGNAGVISSSQELPDDD